MWLWALALMVLSPWAALAHGDGAVPSDLWTHWNADPLVLVTLALPTALYVRGALTYRVSGARFWAFCAGIGVLLLTMVSPLEALSASLFSGHMVQHILFMLVAAPLLVFSRPGAALLRGIPVRWRRAAGSAAQHPSVKRAWAALIHPVTISVVHIVAIWVWHLPGLYELALSSPWVHLIQHITFLGTAALFWQGLFTTQHYGLGVLAAFLTMMATGLLGALMAFSAAAWYSAHIVFAEAWGLTLLEDQQLAGLLMWVPSGFVYVAAAAALLGAWINSAEQRALKREYRVAKELHDV